MHWFCSNCHLELAEQIYRCPRCGTVEGGASFNERLKRALGHPVPETAALAAGILAKRRCDEAIPELLELSNAASPRASKRRCRPSAHFWKPILACNGDCRKPWQPERPDNPGSPATCFRSLVDGLQSFADRRGSPPGAELSRSLRRCAILEILTTSLMYCRPRSALHRRAPPRRLRADANGL